MRTAVDGGRATDLRENYNTPEKNLVGPRVRAARAKGKTPITQRELSIRLEVRGVHIDRAGVSKIETQERMVTDKELAALADALHVSVTWLLGLE